MTLDRDIRDRIALVRFVMIFGIVLLHTPTYVPLAEVGHDPFQLIKAFFQHGVFRATVPVLTAISGFLLFGAGLDLTPMTLYRKKVRSIVLPFLWFNLLVLACALVAQTRLGVRMSYDLSSSDPKLWLDAAFGLTNSPINYPLNFLRDLIMLILLAPVFGWLIRNSAWLGLVLVVLFFFTNSDGLLVLRNGMPLMFYLGGMAALRGWNLRLLDRGAPGCLLLFCFLCAGVVYFQIENLTYLRLVAPMLIWPLTAPVLRTAFGRWCVRLSKFSFFIFVAHAPVLMATWLLYKHAEVVPYPLYWIGTPFVTTAVLVLIHQAANHWIPGPFNYMLGNRGNPGGKRAAPQPAEPLEILPGNV